MGELSGKVVVVTGASRGLGKAIAEAFAAEGAHLVLGSRDQEALDILERQHAGVLVSQCDVSERSDLVALAEAAIGEWGRIDIWVNNAGVAVYGPFLDTTESDFDAMVGTNLRGTYFGSQVALGAMRAHHAGLIVNIGSIAGVLHLPNESAYSATKWAVRGFTGVLRREAAQFNVRVTCVLAGGMDTPFWKEQEFTPFPPEVVPERDFMRPEDVARMIVDVARYPDSYVVPEIVCLPLQQANV